MFHKTPSHSATKYLNPFSMFPRTASGSSPSRELHCDSCHSLVHNAMACGCIGRDKWHRFCLSCLESDGERIHPGKGRKRQCPKTHEIATIREDWSARKEVDALEVKCVYALGYVEEIGKEFTYGRFREAKDKDAIKSLNKEHKLCGWSGTVGSFRAHMLNCPLAPVKCKYCSNILRKFEIVHHLINFHDTKEFIDGMLHPVAPRTHHPEK